MAAWTGSPITAEEAFHQVWKHSVEISPSFYLPNTAPAQSAPDLSSPVLDQSSSSAEDDLVTAEILAGIKFSAPSPQQNARKRSLASSAADEEDVKPRPKRKKESSVESTASGGTSGTTSSAPERWPPRKEFVYLTCVVAIPPVGRQKLPLFGKPCGRNEIIAKVVTLATGEGCSRKLISSHAQVLKGRKELSKQLRDLLTTEEGKNNDDEAAPTVYTLGADWNFPKQLNRLIGVSEDLDLRTAAIPPLITRYFTETPKVPKLASKKERNAAANKNSLTIKTTSTRRPSASTSLSVFSAETISSITDKNQAQAQAQDYHVHLPTPKSSHPSSVTPYFQSTPPCAHSIHVGGHNYGYVEVDLDNYGNDRDRDRDHDRKPCLPSPNDLFSPSYELSTPRKYPEYSHSHSHTQAYTHSPRRPATVSRDTALSSRLLPLPETPVSSRFQPFDASPYITPIPPVRRTSESHLTASLGRTYSTFERECLKIGSDYQRRVSGVSIEDIKRKELYDRLY
ncbi:uncharacterized protein I303_104343 [Kwoniella dejecticola CBS 10117]|uniref:TEA domain-containing protein n=1 Tax=Kwoniella dejecticola CBS 10117 TaxID=1296121 RepID=A0A1A6A5L2_9TREE|nr:uncharacterized protein I303_04682 [Kwoniella dejecticola CBS 10117]OBR85347.1 hypothetical protein I303_04682 [Kwoniella dejecticola CBS 10117]